MNAVDIIKNALTTENIVHILNHYGAMHIAPFGDSIRCTCPLHGGDNATAFMWRTDNWLWYCYTRCKTGGDIFDFIAKAEHLPPATFSDAVIKAAELLNVDISKATICERKTTETIEIMEWLRYKNKKIAIPEFDSAILGPCQPLRGEQFRDMADNTIQTFQLSYNPFFDAIQTPIHDEHDRLVAVTLRMFNPPGDMRWDIKPKGFKKSLILYNLNRIINTGKGYVFLVEGASDVWNMHEIGITQVCASLGSSLSEEQAKLLMKYFSTLYIMYDNDEAGKAGKEKVKQMFKGIMTIKSVEYLGNDPGEVQNEEDLMIEV